jgi:CO/xanthine dehydrogenase Mo-binding subunit
MPALSVVGTSVPRSEGRSKVTGDARYTVDASLPGVLTARVLRSTVPHAVIKGIDSSAALALPGVRGVVTGADLHGLRTGASIRDMPVLAWERVRFVGEPIAMVAAGDADSAEAALALIKLDLDELPAEFDVEAAMSTSATTIHPDRSSYPGAPELPDTPNIQGYTRIQKGDVEDGFAQAELVFEHTFRTSSMHQGYIEPRACMVNIDPDGTVRVWSSCQSPYGLRNLLAKLLELPTDRVIVESTPVGGSFGAKGSVGLEPALHALARATGAPVKYVPTSSEELLAGGPRHASVTTVKTGVNRDGTLVARSARIIMDGGAYGAYKPTPQVILPSVSRALGPYRIPHTRIVAEFVYTNNTPGGVARAPAQPQVVFAGESQMDLIAEALGIDPLEFRIKNAVRTEDVWPHNGTFEGVMTREALERLRDASGWNAPLGPNQGRGMAVSERGIGAGESGLVITVHDDGTATALSGIVDCGTGALTVMRQVLAEELHLPFEAITVVGGNTNDAPPDAGMGGSKHTYSLTVASVEASGKVLDQLRPIAAERLECSEEDLELVGQAFQVRGHAGLNVAVQQVAADAASRAGGTLQGTSGGPTRDQRASQSCIVAYAVDVEVDPETGRVTPLKITAVHDVGTAINPSLLQAQIDGATVQGLGHALMEDLAREDGRPAASHLGDYKLPVTTDLPQLVSVFVEGASGPGPYQAKAVAELSNVPIPAAFANAVARACGARVYSLPVSAESVHRALNGEA